MIDDNLMLKNLSIIVSSKKECENLKTILPILKGKSDDVIVVDGHSKDGTEEVCLDNKVNFVLDNGLGKGDAQRVGALKAKYDYIIFYDADGSHDPNDIENLYNDITSEKFDLIVCSRKKGGSFDLTANVTFMGFIRSTGCDFLTLLFNKFFKTEFSDILYSLKSIKKDKFNTLDTTENGFGIEIDILAKSVKKKYRIKEIPSRENARVHGESKLSTPFGAYFIYQIFREWLF
jgi:glycosyltransferase involved in cell wall biosynthesis